jgi:hypothetical protein
MERGSSARLVGPPGAGCTSAAWSPDGKWIFLNSAAGGAFHIWRQRFPDGAPEQITSGPTEEEGIAIAPDGRSFVTSVGLQQGAVWLHDSRGDRQLSIEGYAANPTFTTDGTGVVYRIVSGTLPTNVGELQMLDLETGRNESVLPGFAVAAQVGRADYDISPDGQRVVVSRLDREGKPRLWLASLDRRSPPQQIPNVEGDAPLFGTDDEIFFRRLEGGSAFAYRVHRDGSGLRKVREQAIAQIFGLAPDRRWLVARVPGPSMIAFPVAGGPPVIIAKGDASQGNVRWSRDGRSIFISVLPGGTSGRTYVIPLMPGRMFPSIPAEGFSSEAEIAKVSGARLIDSYDVAPGPAGDVYAFSRLAVQRNLYRIPLP